MSTSESRTTSSSRLSQFGLYRTIDARTEQFLRLSRKRQLRHGCACAALSTALTVTVVVTVLLVYEYNISPNTNSTRKYMKKPNWLGLLNDSTIEGNFNKANVKIDPTTIKLLPLLIKALNHNSYLANEIGESANNNVGKDGKETTEFPYERNVFTDPKKRMRNSKMFNTEYKTPTMVQIPSRIYPTTDEYAKAKKLRDYQTMLSYFDKLLNAATLSPNREIKKEKENIKENSIATTSKTVSSNLELPLKINFNLQDIEDGALTTPQPLSTKKTCKCKEKIRELLKNFLKSLQDLMPEIFEEQKKENKTTKITEPEYVTSNNDFLSTSPLAISNSDQLTETTAKSYISSTQSTTSTLKTSRTTIKKDALFNIQPITFRPLNVNKYLQDHHTTQKPHPNDTDSVETNLKKDFIFKNINKPRQNNMETLDSHNIEKYTRLYFHRQASTTMRSSAIPTTILSHKTSTEPMKFYKPAKLNSTHLEMSSQNEILNTKRNEDTVTKSNIDKTTLPIVEYYEENNYDMITNQNNTTLKPKTILDDLEKLDVHANELLKVTLVPNNSTVNETFEILRKDKSETKTEENNKSHIEIVQQGTLKETTNNKFLQNDLNSNNIMQTYIKLGNLIHGTEPPNNETTTTEFNYRVLEEKNDTKTQEKRQNENLGTNVTDSGETPRDLFNHSDSEEDNIKLNDGDIQDQEVLNEAVDVVTKPMKRFNKDKSLLVNYQFAAGTGLDIDSNYLNYQPRSMIPENRPTYLEIDRNGWQANTDYGAGDNIPYELS